MFGARYIDPTTDFGFKRLFGQEDSKEILKQFLFDVLALPHPIADLRYIPTEQLPSGPEERLSIYDVYCIDTAGQRFIVEMQRSRRANFKERTLYYATFPITQQIQKGEGAATFALLPIYCIAVLNFRMDDQPRHLRRVQLADIEANAVFYDKLTFAFIELPKFTHSLEEGLAPADQWVYLLKNMPALMDIPAELDKEPFTIAFAIAERAAFTPEELLRYEASFKHTTDEDLIYQGGVEQGAIRKAREIARTMLDRGIERATVADLTGLTEEDLAEL